MKTKIQIKHRLSGTILFEYEKEDNTIKDTLVEAVKQSADLHNADLHNADLHNAYLSDADLSDADLHNADLHNANLRYADLSDADLHNAYLSYADLSDANLRNANLRNANLRNANLRYADLHNANLSDANLRYANLSDAKEIPYTPFACPSDGAFIGWKKVRGLLVKLEIPEDAKRCSATSQKCRCEKAKVLAITQLDGSGSMDEILNTSQEHKVLYKVGEMVYPDSFDENRWAECSHGIHFFINKQDAINY